MEFKGERDDFLQDISRFNCDFSLRGNKEPLFKSPVYTEILNLEKELESLHKGYKALFTALLSSRADVA